MAQHNWCLGGSVCAHQRAPVDGPVEAQAPLTEPVVVDGGASRVSGLMRQHAVQATARGLSRHQRSHTALNATRRDLQR